MELKFGFGGGDRKSVFSRVDTINLVSARNGKVGRIYFLIVMPVYGTVSREGSIFSWLWLSPARATHLTGHMGASHQHMGAAAAGLGRAVLHKTELEQSWSWLVGGTHRHGGRRGSVTRNEKSHLLQEEKTSHLLRIINVV